MKLLIYFIILLFVNTSNAQSFEGIIKYAVEPKNPTPGFISEEEFHKKNPNLKSHNELFFYKNGNYKWVNNKNIDLYDVTKKRVYTYVIGADTSLWNDATYASDSILEIKKTLNKDTVLGFICESMMIRTKWGKTTFSFHRNQLKIDASKLADHTYKYLNEFLKEANCLPLKIVYKSAFDLVSYTAIEIKEQPIDDKEFLIPAFRYPIKNHHQ